MAPDIVEAHALTKVLQPLQRVCGLTHDVTTPRILSIRSRSLAPEDLERPRDCIFDREAEMLENIAGRCRGAEGGHAKHVAIDPDPLAPANPRRRLHCEPLPHRRRQNRLPVP